MKISYLMSTYKRYDLIPESIESVLKQTSTDFELLICSDGVDDRKEQIVKSFNHSNIQYFHLENRSNDCGSSPKNFLIEKATGDWLVFTDDDDVLYDNYIEALKPYLKDDMSMVIHKSKIYSDIMNGRVIPGFNHIQNGDIGACNVIFNSKIGNLFRWIPKITDCDYYYINDCSEMSRNLGFKISFIDNVLTEHKFYPQERHIGR